jgi:hypothetical protein
VERTGLWPVLKAAHRAERHDLAVVAGEGHATEACRARFAHAEQGRDHQLFCVHVADPHRYSIARALPAETERMPEHRITVLDIGLKLEGALAVGLPAEEFTRRKALPQEMVRSLTDLEREHLQGRKVARNSSLCRRVELNAFTAPDLVANLVAGLQRHRVRGKVIPDAQSLPAALAQGLFEDEVSGLTEALVADLLSLEQLKAEVGAAVRAHVQLDHATAWVVDDLAAPPTNHWREALRGRIANHLEARLRKSGRSSHRRPVGQGRRVSSGWRPTTNCTRGLTA